MNQKSEYDLLHGIDLGLEASPFPRTASDIKVPEIVPLWEHQKKAISLAMTQRDYGLLFQMGTGKTLTVISILRHVYTRYKCVLRTLIVTPPITLENWRREWERGSKIADKVAIAYGPRKKRLSVFDSTARIILTNYESLTMPDVGEELLAWAPSVIVWDEVHRVKNYQAKRTKAAIKLATLAKHRYILTGTPILNNPVDIFTQFQVLDCGETFGNNFYAFRNRYLYDANAHMPRDRHFPNWKVRPGALEEINRKIYTKAMRVTKEECLDLPPLVRKTIYVDLTPEQRKAYEEMKKDFITYVKGDACVATIALTKALKLMQITTGFVSIDEDKVVSLDNSARVSALKELLEEICAEHKVIVWCVFKRNYEDVRQVCRELELKFVEVHGDISGNQKFVSVDQFNKDPETKVFIGHPGSGGIGISLVSSPVCIYYSRNFSLENDIQSESRNHRGGSEIHEKITRIDIVAKDTIDELITKRLAEKVSISDKVLRDLSLEI